MGKAAATVMTARCKPRKPNSQPTASMSTGCSQVFTKDSLTAGKACLPMGVCDKVMPTSTRAIGPKALPSKANGRSTMG